MNESRREESDRPGSGLTPVTPWAYLRRYTSARIALGRSGGSLPTRELLAFNLDHALARDAVQAPFDSEALATELRALPLAPEIMVLTSAASDHATYLQRPNLGRQLSVESAAKISAVMRAPRPSDVAIIVSDGLSAPAAQRQVPALLTELFPRLHDAGFTFAPLCVVRHARVGLIDEIGSRLGATFALILLGERPGLGTPDSLGAYFTYAPQPGRTDAARNCVSNIRPAGLTVELAAARLTAWLSAARERRQSGFALKDPHGLPPPTLL